MYLTSILPGSRSAPIVTRAEYIGADVDERWGRVVVFSALDNLGKGAAGSAIQNMKLHARPAGEEC
jgi:N-acetyl-gamma-glutamylphosphate reductase